MSLNWSNAVLLVEDSTLALAVNKSQTETRLYMLELDGESMQEIAAATNIPQIGDPHPDLDDYPTALADVEVKAVVIEPSPSADRAHIRVQYGPVDDWNRKNAYGEIWEWGLATQQQHITSVAKPGEIGPQTQSHYRAEDPVSPSTQAPPLETGRGIGVHGENVEGTDIYSPALSLKIRKEWDASEDGDSLLLFYSGAEPETITKEQWLGRISGALGCVDYAGTAADLYTDPGWIAGHHVLFTGASDFGLTDKGKWGVTYEFLIARHPTDPGLGEITVALLHYDGSAEASYTITGTRGWDYLWLTTGDRHEPATNPAPGAPESPAPTTRKVVIIEAHMARPYPAATESFATLLGIQGSF